MLVIVDFLVRLTYLEAGVEPRFLVWGMIFYFLFFIFDELGKINTKPHRYI